MRSICLKAYKNKNVLMLHDEEIENVAEIRIKYRKG